jgi:predicted N-formylglutamate amidohydrolase
VKVGEQEFIGASVNSSKPYLLVTCEHGGNRIPTAYRYLFAGHDDVLAGHRGYDFGALELAKFIASRLHAPLAFSTTSRLLVELNRSPHNPKVFSEFTAGLDAATKQTILEDHYHAHRDTVESVIRSRVEEGEFVFHLAVHSFTPVLGGEERNADIGLLYDPDRESEVKLCLAWQSLLHELEPELRVRRNYPYLGKSDGFTTYLRKLWPAEKYAGVEIEVNQLWPAKKRAEWKEFKSVFVESLSRLCAPPE